MGPLLAIWAVGTGKRGTGKRDRKAGRVRYWQYGLAGNSPNLAKSDPSRFPLPRFPLPASRFPLPASRFPLPASRFPLPASRFPLPASRFPLPASRFGPGQESGDRKAGRVRYWQYGLAGNSPNLAKSDPSRFPSRFPLPVPLPKSTGTCLK